VSDAAKILGAVTTLYLTSGDFNGTPISAIRASGARRRRLAAQLVRQGKVSVEFGDRHPNPRIRAFPSEPPSKQLRKLKTKDLEYACMYPTKRHLASIGDASAYAGHPFTLQLALGAAQLEYRVFDLAVLERYRNDPRYSYDTNDFTGKICNKTDHYLADTMLERDKVLLEPFGFGYDKEISVRVVIVFLRYLTKLSAEHQQIWKAHELPGTYSLHPVYRDVALGVWYEGISIFDAFTGELQQINELCQLMGRPALFKSDFTSEAKPKEFGFLLRPTLKEFNSFTHLLDKMISDNIDPGFFQGEGKMERVEKRSDGTTVVKPKAKTAALEEWLRERFTPKDPEPLEKMFAAFKEIK